MKNTVNISPALLRGLLLTLMMASTANAHLMVAHHGTLNIIGDDAFMVLSLPVTAFEGLDDDNDGKVSMIELNNHRASIVESVNQNVILSDASGGHQLRGTKLSPVIEDHAALNEPVSQLIVLGRFALIDEHGPLQFQVRLYDKEHSQPPLEITATRRADNMKQVLKLTPTKPAAWFFGG